MNTTENNKILAEFLAEKKGYQILIKVENQWYDESMGYKFHNDWNWLMQVVEKIESLKRSQFSKNTYPCVLIYPISCKILFYGNYEEVITDITRPTKIEAVYYACVEFVKWYNTESLNKK